MTRSVVFVCTGNTCRSPMAEHLYLRLSREAGLPRTAASAGVAAAGGAPLSRGAAAALTARGISSAPHQARRVDKSMLDSADAVYVMERSHRDSLISLFPESAAKIVVLREDAGLLPSDVEDPVGTDAAEYQACASSIEEALKIIVLRESKSYAPNPR